MPRSDRGGEPLIRAVSRRYAEMNPTARRQRLEVLVGILGFFTLISFILAVVAEVKGEPALREAAVLAAFVIATYFAVRAWLRA